MLPDYHIRQNELKAREDVKREPPPADLLGELVVRREAKAVQSGEIHRTNVATAHLTYLLDRCGGRNTATLTRSLVAERDRSNTLADPELTPQQHIDLSTWIRLVAYADELAEAQARD